MYTIFFTKCISKILDLRTKQPIIGIFVGILYLKLNTNADVIQRVIITVKLQNIINIIYTKYSIKFTINVNDFE